MDEHCKGKSTWNLASARWRMQIENPVWRAYDILMVDQGKTYLLDLIRCIFYTPFKSKVEGKTAA